MKFEAPRGTHDILPSAQPMWELVTEAALDLCEEYGYRRIQTPVFEDTGLFARTSGQGSDVVQKEMYTFVDRGDRSLTLRPEGTAPICRAYLEHGLHREPQPQKLYTLATMYRYAAPQKGRYREHWQLSVEAIGSDDPAVDAEVIQLYDALLGRLGITAYELRLNSIGDRACRPGYLDRLGGWLAEHRSELDENTRAKAEASPLRVFDNYEAKPASVQALLAGAPKIGESLCAECAEHFADVRSFLDAYGVTYRLDPTLVRGLDYYTRTTWEFVGPDEGAQSTISGGGRYDGLIEEIGGAPTPGVGFGAGIERLQAAAQQAREHLPVEHLPTEPLAPEYFFLVDPDADRTAALAEMTKLRRAGRRCDTDYARRSPKGQRTQLARSGALGHVHVMAAGAVIRNADGSTNEVPVAEIASTVLA